MYNEIVSQSRSEKVNQGEKGGSEQYLLLFVEKAGEMHTHQ